MSPFTAQTLNRKPSVLCRQTHIRVAPDVRAPSLTAVNERILHRELFWRFNHGTGNDVCWEAPAAQLRLGEALVQPPPPPLPHVPALEEAGQENH
ncbi:hypothetical protein CgunFtcFv8_027457 [Champsocephalus gunnari]|uniref:Uncharacterized protein n=1 Tax=Champsocephalus gunnari TaxID=52237 RepID=A0AAN8HWT5_CHAGU|nr:hypothetical protein CgunFtcFv8_027457 [Champsocephalus gunnari]